METKAEQSGTAKRYGYIRVSSEGQNLARQTEEMDRQGLTYVFSEKISGKSLDRPELRKMLSILSKGDEVVVLSIDRIARNTKDLIELIDEFNSKGVKFISLKENIDTSTPTGKFLITIMGAMAELERAYIRERQQQGIAIAKRQGKYKGRKPKELPNFDEVSNRVKEGRITVNEAVKILGISRSTYYRRLLDDEIIDY